MEEEGVECAPLTALRLTVLPGGVRIPTRAEVRWELPDGSAITARKRPENPHRR